MVPNTELLCGTEATSMPPGEEVNKFPVVEVTLLVAVTKDEKRNHIKASLIHHQYVSPVVKGGKIDILLLDEKLIPLAVALQLNRGPVRPLVVTVGLPGGIVQHETIVKHQ